MRAVYTCVKVAYESVIVRTDNHTLPNGGSLSRDVDTDDIPELKIEVNR